MKFKVTVIAILIAILGVNTVGTVMTVLEVREQTKIALRATEITALQADLEAYTSILEKGNDKKAMSYFIASQAEETIIRIAEIYKELQIEGTFRNEIDHALEYQDIVEDLGK